ncbi:putative adenylyltransferase/sulfurtransferase MoeZ [Pelagimonas phthalicica]|uniref:Putative adenylyltransferase/sulfurtransferase MoeZ n=1 Tax=Pelagimonas phthalicica TaxID=1037362 RepID=A0A238J983_9RHOB|nr:HesA/MoeB/ThiF family protein [Pelagimonas phthalicica]TDS94526.1 molybdopterin/thiamine biosynthesis adenylyltransferase [Pelagimonas phthalicica]SMX26945.1 putative adenylyltransferase/sulfurtransferase MoeZ [Pelagimonas phthalicica]
MSRFARQEQIIGTKAQQALARAHVLVVGAGGLGCPVLQYLAGAGVGEITLMDDDQVEESNLHRQPLYRMEDIGTAKALAAVRHLTAAHPATRLHPHLSRLTPSNAENAVTHVDLVIDAADSFAVSYILSDTCQRVGKPLVSASVLGMSGYVGAFCATAPSLRAVFPDLPDSAANCATAGVLGPVVGMVGTAQAQMAISVLVGADPSPLGQLLTLDMQRFGFGGFRFDNAPDPTAPLPFVDAALLEEGDLLIELRPASECAETFAPAAQRVTMEELADLNVPPTQRLVLGCQTGLRSWRAARVLQSKGAKNLALFAQCAA